MRTLPLCLLLLAACSQLAPARRPNILLIISDDHAAHAMSGYGGRLDQTPNLDRLAAQGARFANAFVTNALCGPSRACMLTGKYGHRNGFVRNGQQFDAAQWTAPRALQQAGYQTAVVGKWHLNGAPAEAGFDHASVLPGQGRYVDPVFETAAGRRKVPGYVTDVVTDQAIEWLQHRDPSRPFFLQLGHKAPHREWTPPPELAADYRARRFAEPATLFDNYDTRAAGASRTKMTVQAHLTKTDVKGEPPAELQGDERTRWYYQRYMQDYLACVQSLDRNIGRLVDWLDQNGLGDTLVVYVADNGFFLGDHGWYDKRWMYEESLRVPLVVRWPGHATAGSVPEQFALNVDLAPTLLDAAGVPVPDDVQGRSLVPVLQGRAPDDWRTSMYYRYYEFPGEHDVQLHYGVRDARHKLIWFPELQAWELYDLQQDPHELHNLAGDPVHAAVRSRLEAELVRLREELGDDDQVSVR